MYNTIGDNIALQYGGSEAHKKVREVSQSGDTSSEIITSIKRYYKYIYDIYGMHNIIIIIVIHLLIV